MQGLTVIDADGHILERDEDLDRYLGEPYNRRRKPYYPQENWDRHIYGTMGRRTFDIETRLKDMDLQGVDISVLFPTNGLFIGRVREPEWAVRLCRAYNELLADVGRQAPRLKGVALLQTQDVPEAAKELNRAVTKLGLLGGMLAAHGHGKNLGHKEFWPIYAEAQRLDVPICIHASGGEEPGLEIFEQFLALHTCAHPFPIMRQCAGMIFGGIPELFPRLKIGFLEAGVGWVPFWFERMDEEYEMRGRVEAPVLKRKPSEYLKTGQLYFGCEPDEEMIAYVAERVGETQILYASDYPHWDMTFDSAHMIEKRSDLSDGLKRRILSENAKRFFKLS
ncbi:MAG: amidohydrolase [Deltaproteobacteria bacterium]|nr:amidohydrolase [Deltaproteobacteria bacterium]